MKSKIHELIRLKNNKAVSKKLLIFLLIIPLFSLGQEVKKAKDYESGKLQLGMRSTLSSFSNDGYFGTGIGGHFRLKFGSRLNSEWYFDYITTDIGGLAHRTDYHIGWSVMYYPFNKEIEEGKFTPFFESGHCFDYTEVKPNSNIYSTETVPRNRLSSAIQCGLGTHYNLTDNFDISIKTQYMLHIGNEIHAEVYNDDFGIERLRITNEKNVGLQGHLLTTLSVNVYITDLWRRKPKQ